MGLVMIDEAVLCKGFPSTLLEKALTWFTALRTDTIHSWYKMEKMFLDKFSTTGEIPKTRGDLTNIKQRDDEPFLDYLEWFKKTYNEIEGLSQDTVLTCFEGGLKSHALKIEFGL